MKRKSIIHYTIIFLLGLSCFAYLFHLIPELEGRIIKNSKTLEMVKICIEELKENDKFLKDELDHLKKNEKIKLDIQPDICRNVNLSQKLTTFILEGPCKFFDKAFNENSWCYYTLIIGLSIQLAALIFFIALSHYRAKTDLKLLYICISLLIYLSISASFLLYSYNIKGLEEFNKCALDVQMYKGKFDITSLHLFDKKSGIDEKDPERINFKKLKSDQKGLNTDLKNILGQLFENNKSTFRIILEIFLSAMVLQSILLYLYIKIISDKEKIKLARLTKMLNSNENELNNHQKNFQKEIAILRNNIIEGSVLILNESIDAFSSSFKSKKKKKEFSESLHSKLREIGN